VHPVGEFEADWDLLLDYLGEGRLVFGEALHGRSSIAVESRWMND